MGMGQGSGDLSVDGGQGEGFQRDGGIGRMIVQQRKLPVQRAFQQRLVGPPQDPLPQVAREPLPPLSVPLKKPGPPRKYEYASEAERKRVARAATRLQIEKLLNNFGLDSDTLIPAGIKERCNIGANTFGVLLRDEKVQDKILRMILQDLKTEDKLLHGFPEDGLNNNPDSSKIIMRDAPSKHGLAISIGGSKEIDK